MALQSATFGVVGTPQGQQQQREDNLLDTRDGKRPLPRRGPRVPPAVSGEVTGERGRGGSEGGVRAASGGVGVEEEVVSAEASLWAALEFVTSYAAVCLVLLVAVLPWLFGLWRRWS